VSNGRGADVYHRENGYISQAMPTPITMNSTNDQAACFTRSSGVRSPRQEIASETSSAKISSAEKWLTGRAAISTQLLRPSAISYASNTLIKFTTPADAMKRVP